MRNDVGRRWWTTRGLLALVLLCAAVRALEAVTCDAELEFGKLVAIDDRRRFGEAFAQGIPLLVVQPIVNGRCVRAHTPALRSRTRCVPMTTISRPPAAGGGL